MEGIAVRVLFTNFIIRKLGIARILRVVMMLQLMNQFLGNTMNRYDQQ